MTEPGDLCDLPATEMLAAMATGSVSGVEVMTAHLERIEQRNPELNAIVSLEPEAALAAATAADGARRRGEDLGPLHGLPIAIKDLVETSGMRTTYGSPIFRDNVPDADASIVGRLRRAGAIVIGKTNTPEFGAGSHTFNPVFGVTRNPYDPDRSSGGSSGGAAAALASGMLPIADGSDYGGSLRNPASFCNVVGLRPSPGRVTNLPAPDLWDPMPVSGPMARNVRDIALVLDAMASPDAAAPLALAPPETSFRSSLDQDVRGLRIAWSADLGDLPVEREVLDALAPARAVFADLGCEVHDDAPDLTGADEAFDVLRALGFVSGHLDKLLAHREQLKDTVVWNIEAGLALTPEQIAGAVRKRSAIVERTFAFFERYDAFALPVSQVSPFPVEIDWVREIDGVPMEHYVAWQRSCSRITVTAHPAISVPAGFTAGGLPVGLQIVGPYRDERRLLRIAHAFECATELWRRRPATDVRFSRT